MLDWIVEKLLSFLSYVLAALPTSPFSSFLEDVSHLPFLGYLNWVLPIGKMLQIGAVSVIFYCLSTVTNAVHQGLDNMMVPVKSASISLVVHIVSLFVMMVVFQWGIYGVVVSKIVFSATASMLNSHALRQKVGYIQEQKKTFLIPLLASAIMGALSLGAYSLFRLLIGQKPATLVAMLIAVAAYGAALVLLGGVSEEEMAEMPKGRLLAKVCRKVRLFR